MIYDVLFVWRGQLQQLSCPARGHPAMAPERTRRGLLPQTRQARCGSCGPSALAPQEAPNVWGESEWIQMEETNGGTV